MINATKEKIASYFQGSSQFVVPFFQRSYVWEEDNWNTLWDNTLSLLNRYEDDGFVHEHFIGTIITKQRLADVIGQSIYDLIDGQQRLTTIALFLQAIGDASTSQMPNLKNTISDHLRFRDARDKSFMRIVPCRNDKAYYDAVLSGGGSDFLGNREHRIIGAYGFFLGKLTVTGFSDERLDRLRLVILNRVPVISMMLSPEDDEQEIFDTINSLGVRLTTGELLKNYMFKEKDIQSQYEVLWEDAYEGNETQVEFWNADKTAGRMIRTNIEVLLYCYLIIKTGNSEVKLEKLFKEYKIWLTGKTIEDKVSFLRELKQYAEIYYSFPSGTDLNQIGFEESEKRFFHIVENLMVTTIYPLVLYLYKTVTNQKSRNEMLSMLESYLVRRNVCRMTTKNYNSLFIQIVNKLEEIREGGEVGPQLLAEIIRGFPDPTNLMPTDEKFEAAFGAEALSNQNAREILFIVALYQVSTGLADVPRLSLGNYSVEHMMPSKWEANWLDREMNAQEKADRSRKVKTLGNLTLVTKVLNSTMQNSAWEDKKKHLKKHSSLRMTVDYLEKDKWDEAGIEERAGQLASDARKIWKWIELGPSKVIA